MLLRPANLARLAVIGVIALAATSAFAYAGGWLSPNKLTPARMIDAFEQDNGPHPGFRRNHAKGVCFAGHFDANGRGARLSTAQVFAPGGRTPVVGRFALAGGMPFMDDGPKAVRSMAVSFRPLGGAEWRTGMNDIPVFPLRTPQAFYDQLRAVAPDPKTGHPDPVGMKAFLTGHPETARAFQTIGGTPFSSGFADARYNSLNAFRFVDGSGKSWPVRWSMVPQDAFAPVQPAAADKNYQFGALAARVANGPVRWRLVVILGQPGDPTADATTAWPENREQVDVGTLVVDSIEPESAATCRDINFDPLVLPRGMAPSDDPLLSARSAAYSQSFTRRAGEAKPPSAVQAAAQAKAGQP